MERETRKGLDETKNSGYAPVARRGPPSVTQTVCSNQAILRHTFRLPAAASFRI